MKPYGPEAGAAHPPDGHAMSPFAVKLFDPLANGTENDAPVPDGAVDANGLDPVTKQRPYLWPSS